MKKRLIALWLLVAFVCVLALSGCADNQTSSSQSAASHSDALVPDSGEQTSEEITQQDAHIPETFEDIVANNLFNGAEVFGDRLLKQEICARDEENGTIDSRVCMMDLYGNELAEYTCTFDDVYYIDTLTATEDGGFLFALGFNTFLDGENVWESDRALATHIIKCDQDGNVQFDTAVDNVEGYAFRHGFEKDGRYYFFGTVDETHDVSPSKDIHMAVLDENGALLKTRRIAGTNFDQLDAVEPTEQGFLLSLHSQSDDGDFLGSELEGMRVYWVFTVDEELEIIGKEKVQGRSFSDDRIGELDGVPVYESDARLEGFDAGHPQVLIDYGDFYLIVSGRVTGTYEQTPPELSSYWNYTETVYSAYDDSGELMFRAAVDSSPDFEAMLEAWNESGS